MNKILIITESVPGLNINGVSTTLKQTKIELERLHYRVQFLTPLDEGFISLPCPTDSLVKLVINPWKVGRMIEQSYASYIHIATEGPLGYAAMRYCEKAGLNFTTSYHTKMDDYISQRFKFIKAAWVTAYLKRLHKSSKSVLVTTASMKKDLEDKGYKRVTVWGRGVDTSIFNSSYREPQDRPYLLYVGRIAVEKNIEAFLELESDYDKVVVGEGPLLEYYKEKYPYVVFKGSQTGKELATIYANAEVFCFPSFTDTLGIVQLESMASGVPIAAYKNATGAKDIIVNGVTGHLEDDLKDAVAKCLILDRVKCEEAALDFTWIKCTAIFLKHLARI